MSRGLGDVYKREAPTYDADDKFTRKNWKEGAAADMQELHDLLASLNDFSIEAQKAAVDPWATENGKKPWNPWRVCLVGTGKGPDMYELAAFLGKDETLRRMQAAFKALGEQSKKIGVFKKIFLRRVFQEDILKKGFPRRYS